MTPDRPPPYHRIGPAADELRVPDPWWGVLGRIRDRPGNGRIVVAGPSDSGKTSLCRILVRELGREARIGRIDCDPGQGTVGIPGTVGLTLGPDADEAPEALRFVGAASPARHFLQTVTGILALARRAEEAGAEARVFDSSGYMDTPAGHEFHHQVVDALDPSHLIVLRRGGVMAPLVRPFRRRRRPEIHELEPSPAVEPRSREERRRLRWTRLERYFRDADRRTLNLGELGYHGMVPDFGDRESWERRLVGLLGPDGFLRAAGVLVDLDPEGPVLTVRAPGVDPGEVASVQFGSMRVESDG